ncbi:MAG: helix-turn-helix domain-containing protein [Actinomycetia bacterium]|nr:helix-turn-helix domain-containing protein [Actinomycetes bacterium]
MTSELHPISRAIQPLVEAVGGSVVELDDIESGDITIEWEGAPVVGVRLADIVSLDRLVATVEEQLGDPLAELERGDKQRAIRMLDERGAFRLRKSIEDVAVVMGVSRITIYNYLSVTKNS